MKISRIWIAISVAAIFGIAISYLDWILGATGSGIRIPRGDSMIETEYWVGLACAVPLGYLFPRNPIASAVTLMWVPVLLRHLAYFFKNGIPNLWPLEIMMIAVLTLPYIGLAYGAAHLRQQENVANVT